MFVVNFKGVFLIIIFLNWTGAKREREKEIILLNRVTLSEIEFNIRLVFFLGGPLLLLHFSFVISMSLNRTPTFPSSSSSSLHPHLVHPHNFIFFSSVESEFFYICIE